MALDSRVREAIQTIIVRSSGESEPSLSVVVDLVTLIASVDGTVDANESDAIRDTVTILLGNELGTDFVRQFVASSVRDLARAGVEASAQQIGSTLSARGIAREGLTVAVGIALVSEGVCAPERGVIDMIAGFAGLAESDVDSMIQALALPQTTL